MHLYTGTSLEFISDATQNLIADKISESFFDSFRYNAPKSEVASWRNSLRAMANAVELAELDDHGVVVEWQLPLASRRLDVLISGRTAHGRDNAVIVELKQWEESFPSTAEECVRTFVGGAQREVLHPSAQVGGYHRYLKDTHSTFSEGDVGLQACSFLHNMVRDDDDEIFSVRHAGLLQVYPVFTGDQISELASHLDERLGGGGGVPVLDNILSGKYHPSKKLLDHTARMIKGESTYVLLDEQRVVFNTVIAKVAEQHKKTGNSVFIVDGGPGTGKSVIALNLVAELSSNGYSTHHATGSKAFTENVRKKVGTRASAQFKYFNTYLNADPDSLDVLICDEAHRIRESSNNRFTKKENRSNRPQIEELIDVAKVTVFFIDDLQVVRPGEVGSKDLIKFHAGQMGAEVFEYELDIQFRCGGSDGFVSWIDNTLGLRRTANVLWEGDESYDFDIVDSPAELQALINQRAASGDSARLVAGFCWPWSKPTEDGELVDDVKLPDWSMPWNAKPESRGLARGIPKSNFWASDPGGLNQVGCVYTAQGFEFDYVGVIFGRDLVQRGRDGWVGQREVSKDSVVKREKDDDRFRDLVKQTYRVLMTRGIKGCYVYFEDPATREFFESRIDFHAIRSKRPMARSAEVETSDDTAEIEA
jgi:uncharacterized protein